MGSFDHFLGKIGEYGEIVDVKQSLVAVAGLPKARLGEVVIFENGEKGQVISLDEKICQIRVFAKEMPLMGERVARTDDFLSVTVSDDLLGTIIDPLGNVISPIGKAIKGVKVRLIKDVHSQIWRRAKITEPFFTGTLLIDVLLPLGNGQKELVIGDCKTGKTSFLLSTAKNQVQEGKIVIFAAIGKKKSAIKKTLAYFQREKILDKIIFITTSADDSANLIYLTPFTAMTIGEYFKEQGKDSLVILDDLSTHAKIYRQTALLSGKFPGRESYPGDIFHIHANLLERAGNFNLGGRRASITCLPVTEVVDGDFTGYITTNLMGITDGHIYFDKAIFTEGRRPAINLMLSVTRVGRQTQLPLLRDMNHRITAFLANYNIVKKLAHFGSELSETVKKEIKKGERIMAVLEQGEKTLFSPASAVILLGVAFSESFFDWEIEDFRKKMLALLDNQAKQAYFADLIKVDSWKELEKLLVANRDKLC